VNQRYFGPRACQNEANNSDGNISRIGYLSDFQTKEKQLVEKDGRCSQVEAEMRSWFAGRRCCHVARYVKMA
jgi:hypothetical protein